MDRELGLVELLHRWVGGLHEARVLPFAIILNLYRFSVAMAGCRNRASDFCGVDMPISNKSIPEPPVMRFPIGLPPYSLSATCLRLRLARATAVSYTHLTLPTICSV